MGAPRRDAGDPARPAPGARPALRQAPLRRAARREASASVPARILGIAEEHLRRLGPDGVTVVAVAAAAGMTHANVYRYFPSRLALLDAVAGLWLRELEASLAAIADAPDPADDKLERLFLALAGAQRHALSHDPHLFAVHRAAILESRPVARRHRARLRLLIESVVDGGNAAGAFDLRDRDRGIAFLFDAAHRFTHPACIEMDAEMPCDLWEARLATMLRAMLRSLRSGRI